MSKNRIKNDRKQIKRNKWGKTLKNMKLKSIIPFSVCADAEIHKKIMKTKMDKFK